MVPVIYTEYVYIRECLYTTIVVNQVKKKQAERAQLTKIGLPFNQWLIDTRSTTQCQILYEKPPSCPVVKNIVSIGKSCSMTTS